MFFCKYIKKIAFYNSFYLVLFFLNLNQPLYSQPVNQSTLPVNDLSKFTGNWMSSNPPGQYITFYQTNNGQIIFSSTTLQAEIKISDGDNGSNIKIIGSGFNCYYYNGFVSNKEMIWDLRKGDNVCPPSANFKKVDTTNEIVENPTQAHEYYFNAKLYEIKGDYGNARKNYNQFFKFSLNYIDPYLRYQLFLKVQEGSDGAREIFNEMYYRNKNYIIEYARILLLSPNDRLIALKDFSKRNSDFGPVWYAISQEYSLEKKGTQTLGDKQEELAALNLFLNLNKQGKFVKYFLDQSLAATWIEDAERRIKILNSLNEAVTNQITLSTTPSAGAMVAVNISEEVREIYYKLPGGNFQSTGYSNYFQNGIRVPNNFFQINCTTYNLGGSGPSCYSLNFQIEIMYKDMSNNSRGPFKVNYNFREQIKQFCKTLPKIGSIQEQSMMLQQFGCNI